MNVGNRAGILLTQLTTAKKQAEQAVHTTARAQSTVGSSRREPATCNMRESRRKTKRRLQTLTPSRVHFEKSIIATRNNVLLSASSRGRIVEALFAVSKREGLPQRISQRTLCPLAIKHPSKRLRETRRSENAAIARREAPQAKSSEEWRNIGEEQKNTTTAMRTLRW